MIFWNKLSEAVKCCRSIMVQHRKHLLPFVNLKLHSSTGCSFFRVSAFVAQMEFPTLPLIRIFVLFRLRNPCAGI